MGKEHHGKQHRFKDRIGVGLTTLGLSGLCIATAIGLVSCKTAEQHFPGIVTVDLCDVDTDILYEGDIVSPKNKSNYAPFPGATLHNPVVQVIGDTEMYVALWGEPFEKFFIEKGKTKGLTTCTKAKGSFRSYAGGKTEIILDNNQVMQSWVEPKRKK